MAWDLSPRRRSARTIGVAACLLAAVIAALVVFAVRAEAGDRAALTTRFDLRHDMALELISAYVTDVQQRERLMASMRMAGDVDAADFVHRCAEHGFGAAVLLDDQGRVIAAQPANAELIGQPLADRYAHLRSAVHGVPAVSGVVPSAALGEPIVAFAVPFDTPTGRRVFSGAYAVQGTSLEPFVQNAAPFTTGQVFLVDDAGAVIAANYAGAAGSPLEDIAPQLRDAPGRGYIGDGAVQQYVVREHVPGTTWDLVFAVDTAELFTPVTGPTRWARWLGITAFALAGAAGLALYRRNLTQRRDYEQRLHELALSDPLTGLANRRAAADRLDKALARARRGTGSVAVMYVDIDKFKTINDQHGHAAGDVILTAVADRLRRLFRAEDTIARLGGDEFAVICEDLPLPEEAERLAARLRNALAEPYRIAGGTVLATASVGLAMTDGYTTADELLDHADRHMYELKRPASGTVGTPTASRERSH